MKKSEYLITFFGIITAIALFSLLETVENKVKTEDLLQFEKWAFENKIFFNTIQEKNYRIQVFLENTNYINKTNQRRKNFKLKPNKFTHLTYPEFSPNNLFLTKTSFKKISYSKNEKNSKFQETKSSINWVEIGAVTPIKTQSNDCRASWAYSAVESLESAYYLFTGNLLTFSPQPIIDCSSSYGNGGCDTGRTDFTLNYIVDEGAILTKDYPISTREERCKVNLGMVKFPAAGYSSVQGEDNLLEKIQKRPVSVSLYSRPLMFYSSGVFDDYHECPEEREGNTGMVVVGYGDDQGKSYWLLKNSWGEEWGEKGYLRLERKKGNGNGICGLTLNVLVPYVKL